ncbi:MAG: LysR family transcriptional regulator [Paracoccaceae bacterium]
MHNRENWDDLRYILAVAEAGSVSAAARQLKVNHATVLRRVAAFEERHGAEIFDKTTRGYTIRGDRLRVIDAAREVENAALAVSRVISGAQAPLRGVVRVTSTDTFCHYVLPPIISRLQQGAQELRIEILSTNAHLDLAQLHADITVRPAVTLGDDLRGHAPAQLGFDVYAKPGSPDDKWLALSGPIARSRVTNWIADNVAPEAITGAGDSFPTLKELAATGMGQAIIPCVLGDADPRLERRRGRVSVMPINIWVASHTDLVDVPRIRIVRDQLTEAIAAEAPRLAGTA